MPASNLIANWFLRNQVFQRFTSSLFPLLFTILFYLSSKNSLVNVKIKSKLFFNRGFLIVNA